ncbi:MAG: hypothetical protein KDD04_11190, partial [Sinomicrobium sp.]|nr:hypothetical protein [Sinomicrobium sp.]
MCFFLMLGAYAQDTRHIGTWKGVDDNEDISMTLGEDGFIALEVQGKILGGKEFELKGKKMSTPYEIEYVSGSPRFTIMLKDLETGAVESRMAGSITFKENNTAYICMRELS